MDAILSTHAVRRCEKPTKTAARREDPARSSQFPHRAARRMRSIRRCFAAPLVAAQDQIHTLSRGPCWISTPPNILVSPLYPVLPQPPVKRAPRDPAEPGRLEPVPPRAIQRVQNALLLRLPVIRERCDRPHRRRLAAWRLRRSSTSGPPLPLTAAASVCRVKVTSPSSTESACRFW